MQYAPPAAMRSLINFVRDKIPSGLYAIGNLGKAVVPPAYRRGRQAIAATASAAMQAAPYIQQGVSSTASAASRGVRRAASASAAAANAAIPSTMELASRAASRSKSAARSVAANAIDAAVAAAPVIKESAKSAVSKAAAAASSASENVSVKAAKAAEAIKDTLSKLDISDDVAEQADISVEALRKIVNAMKQKAIESPIEMAKFFDSMKISTDRVMKLLRSVDMPLHIDLKASLQDDWLTTLSNANVYTRRAPQRRADSPGRRTTIPRVPETGMAGVVLGHIRRSHGRGLDVPTSAKPKVKAKAKAKAKRAPKKAVKPVVEYHDLKDNPYVVKPKLQLPEKPSNKKSV